MYIWPITTCSKSNHILGTYRTVQRHARTQEMHTYTTRRVRGRRLIWLGFLAASFVLIIPKLNIAKTFRVTKNLCVCM